MIERDNALKEARAELADESKKAPTVVDFIEQIVEAREQHALTRTELLEALSGLELPAPSLQ